MSGARPCLSLILVVSLLLPVTAAHAEFDDDRTLSPHFFIEGGDPSIDRLPLLGTSVTANVSGVIADVTVKQSYRNEGSRPIHAKYVFPASTRAAVHGLVMIVGNQRITALIREREQAAKEYAAAKEEGRNAALLEQQRPNVFTMNVANLMPGQAIDVELSYTELLVPEEGVYEFVYPTVVGPRYSTVPEAGAPSSDRWLANPYTHEGEPPSYTFELAATVNAGLPIRDLASPSHAIAARWDGEDRAEILLDDSEAHGGDRDFVLRYRLTGDAIQSGLMLHEGADENFFLMMLQPPQRVTPEQIPPREYIFIVDVSGSMRGFPLTVSKALLRDLVSGLRPIDRFNVLFFAGGSRLWAPESRFASAAHIEDAIAMIDGETGGGGTELLAAVKRAMALPGEDGASRSLIVVTDGYVAAEDSVFAHIRGHLDEANVFAFGIGTSVNRHLIEGIARAGMGEPFVVLTPLAGKEAAARFRDYVSAPVLTGVRVAFDGFDAYDVEPASVPDVFADRPVIVHGKWRGAPQGSIVVTGTSGEGAYRTALDAGVEPDSANAALRRLWARARIADLSDRTAHRGPDGVKSELVDLGLRYNLLTQYTSFIAVHDVVVNDGEAGRDVTQALPMPGGVSDAAIGAMGQGPEPDLVLLSALLGLLALAVTQYRQRRNRCA